MRYFLGKSDTSDASNANDTSDAVNSCGASKTSASVNRPPSYC